MEDFWHESWVFGGRSSGSRRQWWVIGMKSGFLAWCWWLTVVLGFRVFPGAGGTGPCSAGGRG